MGEILFFHFPWFSMIFHDRGNPDWRRIERKNIALRRPCTIMAISRQHEALLFSNNDKTSTIDSAAHFRPLNSLEHWLFSTPVTNIQTGRDSTPAPLSFEPQPDHMGHRGRRGVPQGTIMINHIDYFFYMTITIYMLSHNLAYLWLPSVGL